MLLNKPFHPKGADFCNLLIAFVICNLMNILSSVFSIEQFFSIWSIVYKITLINVCIFSNVNQVQGEWQTVYAWPDRF